MMNSFHTSDTGFRPNDPAYNEKQRAAIAALDALVKEARPDLTSRIYKKYVRVARQGRILTARKCAIKLGVPSVQIDAVLTLLEG